jgi:hypothetical protein
LKKVRQWEWVKARAMKINEFIARGYLVVVLDEEGEGGHVILTKPIGITESNDRGNPEVYYEPCKGLIYQWYEHTPDWDHGYYDTRETLHRGLFARIRVYTQQVSQPFEPPRRRRPQKSA